MDRVLPQTRAVLFQAKLLAARLPAKRVVVLAGFLTNEVNHLNPFFAFGHWCVSTSVLPAEVDPTAGCFGSENGVFYPEILEAAQPGGTDTPSCRWLVPRLAPQQKTAIMMDCGGSRFPRDSFSETAFLVHEPASMKSAPAALVTGASRGIGRAIAEELGRLGYAVVVNYLRSRDLAVEVVNAIDQAGTQSIAVQGDVALATDRAQMVEETLAAFGRIDLLVNNAGMTSPGRLDLLDLTEESWEQVFATNLKGPFFLSQLVSRQMIRQREEGLAFSGRIININSISAYAVSTNRADYCLTKAALGMMTQLLATRLAEHQVAVFEICPGVIASDMTAPVQEKYSQLIAEGLSPIRRWGQPEDVAQAVAAIVGGFFPFSTGERLNVDGGFHIRRL